MLFTTLKTTYTVCRGAYVVALFRLFKSIILVPILRPEFAFCQTSNQHESHQHSVPLIRHGITALSGSGSDTVACDDVISTLIPNLFSPSGAESRSLGPAAATAASGSRQETWSSCSRQHQRLAVKPAGSAGGQTGHYLAISRQPVSVHSYVLGGGFKASSRSLTSWTGERAVRVRDTFKKTCWGSALRSRHRYGSTASTFSTSAGGIYAVNAHCAVVGYHLLFLQLPQTAVALTVSLRR